MAVLEFDTEEMQKVIDELEQNIIDIDSILGQMQKQLLMEQIWKGLDFSKFSIKANAAMGKLWSMKKGLCNYSTNLGYAKKIYDEAQSQVDSMIAGLPKHTIPTRIRRG